MKDKIAKTIRVISIPPLLITLMIILLFNLRNDIFRSAIDAVVLELLLGLIPMTAYLFHAIVPPFKKKDEMDKGNLLSFLLLQVIGLLSFGPF